MQKSTCRICDNFSSARIPVGPFSLQSIRTRIFMRIRVHVVFLIFLCYIHGQDLTTRLGAEAKFAECAVSQGRGAKQNYCLDDAVE